MEEVIMTTKSLARDTNEKVQKKFNKQVIRSACRSSQDSHNQSKSEQRKQNNEQQGECENKRQKNNQKQEFYQSLEQRLKMRKYDYLNKYNQHQLLTQSYKNCLISQDNQKQNININLQPNLIEDKFPKKRLERFITRQRKIDQKLTCSSLQLKNRYNTSLPNQRNMRQQFIISQSRSPSSTHSKNQLQKPHFQYLQAYKNHNPQDPFYTVTNSNYNSHNYSPLHGSPKKSLKNVIQVQTFANEEKSLNSTKKSLKQAITRIPNLGNGLTVQICHQNQLYRGQVNEYRRLVAKLQIDLMNKKQQLIFSKKSMMNQKLCYQQIIQKLREEIKILAGYRQRYEILNQEMQELNRKKQQFSLENSNKGLNNLLCENNKKQMQRRTQQMSRQISEGIVNTIVERFEFLFDQSVPKKIRSNEKVLNYQRNKRIEEIAQKMEKIIQKNKKYQDLIYSIEQMYKKIQKINKNRHNGHVNPSIKQIWKWLKYIGSVYSFVLQIKPLLCNKVGIGQKQSEQLQIKNILEILLINT